MLGRPGGTQAPLTFPRSPNALFSAGRALPVGWTPCVPTDMVNKLMNSNAKIIALHQRRSICLLQKQGTPTN